MSTSTVPHWTIAVHRIRTYPHLVKALEQIVFGWTAYSPHNYQHAINLAQEALALAKKGTP